MAEIKDIREIDIGKLIPYINNAKKHSDDQVTKIAASIREFGFVNPVLIDKDYNVVAGHGRILAAKKLGMDKVPCAFIEGLTKAQRRAYILADNRLGELAEWDMELVNLELDSLDLDGFDVSITGFDLGQSEDLSEGGGAEAPGFNYKEQYGVIVMCKDEADQEDIYNRLTGEGYDCKVVAT